ncbi:unnamed protein product [Fraxinus pennsylvanica]|uniref:Uncharacterized protein n=1 Tax=Fraxinus pennsylvanica TaxID=56036 RepID=A0AAD2A971_9LAMI|nr:unnamed protein product [Fraxinus pennsylvanica]
MAKTRPGKRDLDSYTIRGTNKVVRVGDCVLMRPSENDSAPYVARVEKIEADNRNNVKVRVRWYYRPEESVGGRRQFHGAKELFLSDHFDTQSAHTIEEKCIVHTFKNYTKLENVGPEDYYCRFEYKPTTGAFLPDRVAVYCKCEMPYNPDDLMIQCEECKDWYHPACVGMNAEQAKELDHFVCSDCASDMDVKKSRNTALPNGKVEPKRQKSHVASTAAGNYGVPNCMWWMVSDYMVEPVEWRHLHVLEFLLFRLLATRVPVIKPSRLTALWLLALQLEGQTEVTPVLLVTVKKLAGVGLSAMALEFMGFVLVANPINGDFIAEPIPFSVPGIMIPETSAKVFIFPIFSSRWPDYSDHRRNPADVLKHDILAPGHQIWAAWSPMNVLNPILSGKPIMAEGFTAYSLYPAAPFGVGAGLVDPIRALDPGPIFSSGYEDYLSFLCSLQNSDPTKIRIAMGGSCAATFINPADLNLPSVTISVPSGSRRVKAAVVQRNRDSVDSTEIHCRLATCKAKGKFRGT